MKSVRLIIGVILVIPGIIFGSQYQVLDVCIQVELDQFFRKGSISADELEKYGRFGVVEAPPFDKYFRVSSAFYDDFLDAKQLVEMKKNLLKQVPLMIKNDIEDSLLLKQYRFPKFLPKTFIEKLENCQNDSSPFQHRIYKYKNSGNTKTLALRYWVGDVAHKEKLCQSVARRPQIESRAEGNKGESFFASDYVIDLLSLLALFTSVTMK